MTAGQKTKGKTPIYIGEEREVEVERQIYTVLPKGFNPAMYSFGCPIGQVVCGQLAEIHKEFSIRNVFVAIPYSDYDYEDTIKEVLVESGLSPKLAKDKIHSKILLCKVCKEIRKCNHGVVDISKSNLNVIYELGLMQSLGIKCAVLFQEGSERPTDLQGIENVLYNDDKKLQLDLARWIQHNVIESDTEKVKKLIKTLSAK